MTGHHEKKTHLVSEKLSIYSSSNTTRPSVDYAKDGLDQLFPIPGLRWSGKGYHFNGCEQYGAVNNHFPVYLQVFTVDQIRPILQFFYF